MTEKSADTALAIVASMERECQRFVGTGQNLTSLAVQTFVANIQAKFSEVQTAFQKMMVHDDIVTIANYKISSSGRIADKADLQSRFAAAVTAGQSMIAEYAANVDALRRVDPFDPTTGLFTEHVISAADLVEMRSRASALITALQQFTD